MTLNAGAFREAVDRAKRAGHLGREAALRQIGTRAVGEMRADARRRAYDTGRFLRGLDMAQNDLGVMRVPVTATRTGRYAKLLRIRLLKQRDEALNQLNRWQRAVERYAERGGPYTKWKSYRDAVRFRERAFRFYERADEQLEAIERDPNALVLGGKKTAKLFALSGVARAITKLYGAEARVQGLAEGTLLVVRHMEPHSRIVEKRTGITRLALARWQASGVDVKRIVARRYLGAVFPRRVAAAAYGGAA